MPSTHSHTWFSLALLWFGAAVSVAEIMTGGMIAPAGLWPGLWAILFGHLFGVLLLGLVAYIGYREQMPTIMCTRISFGEKGSWVLSVLNVIQLVGWTAVMIQQSGLALGGIVSTLWQVEATIAATLTMGALIALWTLWEIAGRHKGNTITVILLFLLTVFISWVLWGKAATSPMVATVAPTPMPFLTAFELSLVMPLSWVPLVADYARKARSLRAATLAPALGYLVGSLWMYGIGFAGALFTGEADPTPMLLAAGLGIAALGVVVLATVTTTFLDVYSAVVSVRNIAPKLPEKSLSLIVVVIGTGLALWTHIYEPFLAFIGAAFAPMCAILLTDYFLLKADSRNRKADAGSLISLAIGFIAYYVFNAHGSLAGPGLSSMAVTFVVQIAMRKLILPQAKPSPE